MASPYNPVSGTYNITGAPETGAFLCVTDIEALDGTGVYGMEYEAGTIPVDIVVTSYSTDANMIRVHIIADGGKTYTPAVMVNSEPVLNLVEDQYDNRYYTGYVDIPAGSITVTDGFTVAGVQRAPLEAGPVVTSFELGDFPGTQTALKQGDMLPCTVTVENSADLVEVLNEGAGTTTVLALDVADSGGAGYKLATGTIQISAIENGEHPLVVVGYSPLGVPGESFSSAPVLIDQDPPSASWPNVDDPPGQYGIKLGETASVTTSFSDFTSIIYSSPSGYLSIPNPTVYEETKIVTCIAGEYGFDNMRIEAHKASNDTVRVRDPFVYVETIPPVFEITGTVPGTHLTRPVSGPKSYPIVISATPSYNTLSTEHSATTGSISGYIGVAPPLPLNWNIYPTAPIGPASITITAKGVTGIEGTGTFEYVIAGFDERTVTFEAYSQIGLIGIDVYDINKTVVFYAGGDQLTLRHDTEFAVASYTIVDADGNYDPNGRYLFLNDSDFAGSNTTGTLQCTIEEVSA